MNRMTAHQSERACVRYPDRRGNRRAVHDEVDRRVEADAAQQRAPYVTVGHGADDLSVTLDDGQLQITLIDAPERLDQGRVFADDECSVHGVLFPVAAGKAAGLDILRDHSSCGAPKTG